MGQGAGTVEAMPPTSAASDAALVERARADGEAFALLYARYLRPIYRYCYHRLGDAEAAEDATSQTFARAFAALPTCDPASFRARLFAIAHHVVSDQFRHAHPAQPLEAADDVADVAPSPEETALAADRHRALQAVLRELPSDQRRVVELRLAGRTGPEIAQVLGRSHDAVKKLQARAIVRLRALLGVDVGPRGERLDV